MSLAVLGAPVALEAQGPGGAPTALFLHGNPDTKETWRGVFAALRGAQLRCVAPDLPGFGATPPRPEPPTLEALGAWTAALVDALDAERVHLVVHDVGGFYGLPFAIAAPERVASLTILNTLFWPDYRWHRFGKLWRTPLLGELAARLSNRWIFVRELRRGSSGYPLAEARAVYARVTPTTWATILRLYRAMPPSVFGPWEPRLLEATSRIPTRVIWGERDPYIPARFADRFGTTAVERLPDVGHFVQVERPALVAERVRAAAGVA